MPDRGSGALTFGITGNADKEQIWHPVERTVKLLLDTSASFVVAQSLSDGLVQRGFVAADVLEGRVAADYVDQSDVILSFGGDGTLLNTVHEVGARGVPVLGVNLGRLGFLALVDESRVEDAVRSIQARNFRIEERRMLHVIIEGGGGRSEGWGLNEVVVARSGVAGLLTLDVRVDGDFLNSYWADGLIISTPTGSTAYNLSAGGPIISPGSSAIAITPLAPHSLTERPIVLPMDAGIEISVHGARTEYVVAVDGRSAFVHDEQTTIRVGPASRTVRLVALPGQSYFDTLRSKLMWGSPRKE